MRKRSAKLVKIIALAEAEERRSGMITGQYQRIRDEQHARLEELYAYRRSYESRSDDPDGVSASHWKDYQGFLERLDKAVGAQKQIVSDSEQKLALHRRQWQAKRQRLQSLERALDRYLQEERRHAERLQQRSEDDRPLPGSPYGDD